MNTQKEPITATELKIIENNEVAQVKEEVKEPTVADRIVLPHTKVSREVKEEDVDRVVEEVRILHELCYTDIGFYKGALAMAHPQIDNNDPLRVFVTMDAKIIINPIIKRHSNYFVESKEACMTFPNSPVTKVQRWQKMEVEYQTIQVDPEDENKFKLSRVIEGSVTGRESHVFQHEIDHLDAKYIYPYENNKDNKQTTEGEEGGISEEEKSM